VAQDVAEQHFGLAAEAFADVVVEIRERQQVGRDFRLDVAQLQPLTGEVAHESVRTPVRDHALYLRPDNAGLTELTRRSEVEQALVRDAAPKEERQAGREIHIAHPMRGARLTAGGIAFDSIEKRRTGQHTSHTGAYARVERFAILTGLPVEIHRRLHIGGRNGATIRAASDVREEAVRAGNFGFGVVTPVRIALVRRLRRPFHFRPVPPRSRGGIYLRFRAIALTLRLRSASEDAIPAGGCADAGDVIWSFDQGGANPRQAAHHVNFLTLSQ